jgi:cell division protein FtsX
MIQTIAQMFRVGWKQSLVASFIVLCLLLLVHILSVLARNAWKTSLDVQQQLGVFIYLRDDAAEEGVKLLEEMKQAGLTTTFFSKDDAFRLLAKKLPDVLDQLSVYGIDNPLPPTVYIVYRNQEQYEAMKSIVGRYDSIISTLDNLSLSSSFEEQTRRASRLVTMMHVIFALCILLIVWVVVMIGMVISYIVTNFFYRFQQQVELTSLLGGSRWVVLAPFVWVITSIMFIARLWGVSLSWYGAVQIDAYFLEVLETSFMRTYLPAWSRWVRLLAELFILWIISVVLIDLQIRWFLRKR